MDQAKIRLSENEMELVANKDWILTKNLILEKVKTLLGIVLHAQQEIITSRHTQLPPEVLRRSPKISKGENYEGLPYLMLDHPRLFDKEDILAIRTMFWWGNFFSITLHLAGKYKKIYESAILDSFELLAEHDTYFCVHQNEWEHHFEKENYHLIKDANPNDWQNQIRNKSFIKLAHKIPLQQWHDAQGLLVYYFNRIIELLVVNYPNDEKDPLPGDPTAGSGL